MELDTQLPWPPSINHYWRRAGRNVHISREGRLYRHVVVDALKGSFDTPLSGRLAVHIEASPPDNRRRDLDNLQKPLLDALQHAGIYEDDSQIDWLLIERKPRTDGGLVSVRVSDLAHGRPQLNLPTCN